MAFVMTHEPLVIFALLASIRLITAFPEEEGGTGLDHGAPSHYLLLHDVIVVERNRLQIRKCTPGDVISSSISILQ